MPALAMTRVGTLMAGRMLRTSNSYHSRIIAAAVAGLADRRWICAYHRRKLSSAAAVGAIRSRSAPVPQLHRTASAIWSMSA